MKYNFDLPTNRKNTGSLKWDVAENELPMWVADMDFETAPAIKEAILKTAERGIFGYSVVPDEYFESIADFFERRYSYRPNPEWMVYTNGIVAAISSMVRKLTTVAENVVLQPPVYNIFYNCIKNNGRCVLENELIYENGEYRMDFSDLEEKLSRPETTLMILCNPHNPVGKIWDKETLSRVGELCKKHGVTVISDEIHFAFTKPGKKYIPFAAASEVCAEVSATCVSASKAFNVAGLQSAAVIAKNPYLRHKIWRGVNTDEVGEPNVFAMDANIAAYRDCDAWLDALVEYIFENRAFAESYIRENIPKLKAVSADATYLLWVDISAYSDDSVRFCEDLRKKTGLFLNDGTEYGSGGERFVRINLATQRANVAEGMKRLREYVENL
jgi:cystathionine beta-lyase